MGRRVGPSLKAPALLLIFLLLQHERWVCLETRCSKGKPNGGVVLRVGSDSGACSSPVALPVVCIKTFFFSKARHLDWEKSAMCGQFYQFCCGCSCKLLMIFVAIENVLSTQNLFLHAFQVDLSLHILSKSLLHKNDRFSLSFGPGMAPS